MVFGLSVSGVFLALVMSFRLLVEMAVLWSSIAANFWAWMVARLEDYGGISWLFFFYYHLGCRGLAQRDNHRSSHSLMVAFQWFFVRLGNLLPWWQPIIAGVMAAGI